MGQLPLSAGSAASLRSKSARAAWIFGQLVLVLDDRLGDGVDDVIGHRGSDHDIGSRLDGLHRVGLALEGIGRDGCRAPAVLFDHALDRPIGQRHHRRFVDGHDLRRRRVSFGHHLGPAVGLTVLDRFRRARALLRLDRAALLLDLLLARAERRHHLPHGQFAGAARSGGEQMELALGGDDVIPCGHAGILAHEGAEIIDIQAAHQAAHLVLLLLEGAEAAARLCGGDREAETQFHLTGLNELEIADAAGLGQDGDGRARGKLRLDHVRHAGAVIVPGRAEANGPEAEIRRLPAAPEPATLQDTRRRPSMRVRVAVSSCSPWFKLYCGR